MLDTIWLVFGVSQIKKKLQLDFPKSRVYLLRIRSVVYYTFIDLKTEQDSEIKITKIQRWGSKDLALKAFLF